MSFGWSAGDIAQAITLVVKVVKALDEAHGAASDYREAVDFLKSLQSTLEPLQTATVLRLPPAYSDVIRSAVEKIQEPIEKFLKHTAKFEASLGSQVHPAARQNAFGKLRWSFKTSKRVSELRTNIESHLGILNNLLHRLTLEALTQWILQPSGFANLNNYRETVGSMETNIEGKIQRTFTDVIVPRLISTHQQQLRHVNERMVENQKLATNNHEAIISRLDSQTTALDKFLAAQPYVLPFKTTSNTEQETMLSKLESIETTQKHALDTIKQQIDGTREVLHNNRLQRLDKDLLSRRGKLVTTRKLQSRSFQAPEGTPQHQIMVSGSLEDLYYLVLVYLGYFLRDLLIKPVPALTPTLLAKYNISFSDAFGRPPRVLDISCFVSYKVFKAFLEESFADTDGSKLVDRGAYKLTDARDNEEMTAQTWSQKIVPGSHVIMYMTINEHYYGETECPGFCSSTLIEKPGSPLKICSECGKEIRTKYEEKENFEDVVDPWSCSWTFKRVERRLIKTPRTALRPSMHEIDAEWTHEGTAKFLTSTFGNSHYYMAHYNNPYFEPAEWSPESDEPAPRKQSS